MIEKEAGKQPNHPRAPPPFPPPNCPRCCSTNTKFCYYNNYSVSQPRYLCKECRRYWTHGGVLRNIPCGGTTRKRGRVDCASSSSQFTKPPATALAMRFSHDLASIGACSSDAYGTLKPEITQTMQPFNNGGFCYQPTFLFNPNCELGGVNTVFGAVNVTLGGRATPQPAPLTMMVPQLSTLNDLGEFGVPFVQPSLHYQPPPQPPTAWADQNTSPTTANVVSINEWYELKDMDNEP
ncbi:hypothetical protein R6Q57_015712 [Mikania cordata]